MDSLLNILSNKDFDEPPEISVIKDFVRKKYNADAGVQVRDRDIIIIVKSAALANSLRLQTPDIKKQCDTKKRLVFKIA